MVQLSLQGKFDLLSLYSNIDCYTGLQYVGLCFILLLMIIFVVPAVQSSPDVTNVSEVDSTPLGMYVAT